MQVKVSYKPLITHYRNQIDPEKESYNADYIRSIVKDAESVPELMEGVELNKLPEYRKALSSAIRILFPSALTENEIKAVTIPFSDKVLRCTNRYKRIMENADEEFKFDILKHSKVDYEMLAYGLILKRIYGHQVDFHAPLTVSVPQEEIPYSYRISYNADYIDVELLDEEHKLDEADISELKSRPYDKDFWREMFPKGAYMFNGFGILTMIDVTVDEAISQLKDNLLHRGKGPLNQTTAAHKAVFRKILKVADLDVGVTLYDADENLFQELEFSPAPSFMLKDSHEKSSKKALDSRARTHLIENIEPLIITDVEKYHKEAETCFMTSNLLKAKAGSAIFYPINEDGKLLGLLELVSPTKFALSSFNVKRIDSIISYIRAALLNGRKEYEDRIKAIIQTECTSIHDSVQWRFEREARRILRARQKENKTKFRDLVFKDVFPLYGQMDIVGSSKERNNAIRKDFMEQLDTVCSIVNTAKEEEGLPIYDQIGHRVLKFQERLKQGIDSDSERKITNLLKEEINPVMRHIKSLSNALNEEVSAYESKLDEESGIIYNHRYDYDHSVQIVNDVLTNYLDEKQAIAQGKFPHYFERFKTDGVEHNMYTGDAILHQKKFNEIFLFSLRLWQLTTMVEMEVKFDQIRPKLPMDLEAASMILVFDETLDVKYRIDEKRFDVDGTYNARYEVIKKRIDKALVKGTDERITQARKLSIIYSGEEIKQEYQRYLTYLISKNYLKGEIEYLELKEVQGVVGLKALRIDINYELNLENLEEISYENLSLQAH